MGILGVETTAYLGFMFGFPYHTPVLRPPDSLKRAVVCVQLFRGFHVSFGRLEREKP